MGVDATRELFAEHYLIMAFLTTLGVVQLAVARGSLRGLSLTAHRKADSLVGMALLVSGFALYFLMPLWVEGPWATASDPSGSAEWTTVGLIDLTAARNVSDVHGGLSGNAQAVLLLGGCVLALVVSAVTGLIRRRFGDSADAPATAASGLEALETGTIVDAIATTRELARADLEAHRRLRAASPDPRGSGA